MLIIPAIDIKNGKCVRLTQGDFSREKVYNNDPVAMAKQWEREGAKMLHIVDLDGAKNGIPSNLEVIEKIAESVRIPVQVGGGIRNKEAAKKLISKKVSRVILGTLALEDEEELKSILKEFASRVAIALDIKEGKLMKKGWLADSDKNIVFTALEFKHFGVQRFIYTDVIKDGTLTGPNYNEIADLTKNIGVPTIVGGGISDIGTIEKLKSMGIEGVILGKALYEGKINLREAINAG